MKWKSQLNFIKRLNETAVNNTQIQICLFSEHKINKQNYQKQTSKQQGQGFLPGHILPGRYEYCTQPKKICQNCCGRIQREFKYNSTKYYTGLAQRKNTTMAAPISFHKIIWEVKVGSSEK